MSKIENLKTTIKEIAEVVDALDEEVTQALIRADQFTSKRRSAVYQLNRAKEILKKLILKRKLRSKKCQK